MGGCGTQLRRDKTSTLHCIPHGVHRPSKKLIYAGRKKRTFLRPGISRGLLGGPGKGAAKRGSYSITRDRIPRSGGKGRSHGGWGSLVQWFITSLSLRKGREVYKRLEPTGSIQRDPVGSSPRASSTAKRRRVSKKDQLPPPPPPDLT